MTWIISKLGDWLWPVVGMAFAALVAALGADQIRVSNRDTTIAQKEALISQKNADIAKLEGDAASSALVAQKKLDQEKLDHDQQLAKANDEAATKTAQVQSDAASAINAGNQLLARLRARLAASTAVARSGNAASNLTTPSFGETVSTTGMYSELFSTAIGEAQLYAGIADRALVAGEQCEASYPVK